MTTTTTADVLQKSLPRYYKDVNLEKSEEYWDYEKLSVNWGFQDDYEVINQSLNCHFIWPAFFRELTNHKIVEQFAILLRFGSIAWVIWLLGIAN